MKTFSKINKPLILGSFVIFALLFLGLAQVYSESACSNQLSGLNRFSSCQVNVGDTLVVNAEGCTNTCYKITNSTANNIFVPTNTCTEWDAFLAHLPTGVTTDTCITAPTISVSNTTKTFNDPSFTITHSTNSAGAKTFSSSNISVATITNAGVVTIAGGGTTTITFNTAATVDHSAGEATATLTVNKAVPTCSVTATSKKYGDADFTIGNDTNSPGTKSFSSGSTSIATINSSTGLVHIVALGTVTITMNVATTTNYSATSCSNTLTINKATPTCTCSPTTKKVGDSAYTIGFTTTNDTGTKSYTSGTTSVATIGSSTGLVTIVGVGTSTMTCSVAAGTNHNAATCTGTQTVSKGDQAAPAAPTLSSATLTSIVLNACSGDGCEYRLGTGSWQTSTTFSGLTEGTSYSFTQKKVATTNYNESPASSAASFSTAFRGIFVPVGAEGYNMNGDLVISQNSSGNLNGPGGTIVFLSPGYYPQVSHNLLSVDVLVVAGGGAGGWAGGGGGAGGLIDTQITTTESFEIYVGNGGNQVGGVYTNAENSYINDILATAGGRGGHHTSDTTYCCGESGGSGGGGSTTASTNCSRGYGISGQGKDGGTNSSTYRWGGAAGGGFSSAGGASPGQGGEGIDLSDKYGAFVGDSGWFAGGGGGTYGYGSYQGGAGGLGGGGAGGIWQGSYVGNCDGGAGMPGTGGGAGGGGYCNDLRANSGPGGSGVVIIKW